MVFYNLNMQGGEGGGSENICAIFVKMFLKNINMFVNSLFFVPTNETEISEIISNVKNSSAGYNGTTFK